MIHGNEVDYCLHENEVAYCVKHWNDTERYELARAVVNGLTSKSRALARTPR